MNVDDIPRLRDEILEISSSASNLEKKENQRKLIEGESGFRPLVFARPLRPYMAALHRMSLSSSLTDSAEFLLMDLLIRRSEALDFTDDTWIAPFVDIWLGVVYEATVLGVPWHTREDTQAWFGEPPVRKASDAEKFAAWVEEADLSSVGMMELAHRHFDYCRKTLPEDFLVVFPRWFSGNLRMVEKLRGDNTFFMDLYDNPDLIHRLMELVTRFRRRFDVYYRGQFGEDVEGNHTFSSYLKCGFILGNDEVDGNIISPAMYRDFVLSSDLEFCKDHREIYFHSCGNLTPMLAELRKLPNISILHVSSLSNFEKAVEVFGNTVMYEKAISDWDDEFLSTAKGDTTAAMRYLNCAKEHGVRFYFMTDVERADEAYVGRVNGWVETLKRAIETVYG